MAAVELSRGRTEYTLVFIPISLVSAYLGGKSGHVCGLWKNGKLSLDFLFLFFPFPM